MTAVQSMMISVCFGAVMSTLIAEVICMIRFTIEDRKKKKHKRREKDTSADKAE